MALSWSSWLIAFLLIVLLVVAHELCGHYLFARLMGMKVTKASLFFGPYIWKREHNGTLYRLGLLPLGGSVNILGFTEKEEVDPAEEHRTYRSAAAWRQMVVILAGPAVNIVLGLAIIVGYFTLIGAPTVSQRIASVAASSPSSGMIQPGDRLLAVNGVRGQAAKLSDAIAASRCSGSPTQGCSGSPLQLLVQRNGATKALTITPTYDTETRRMRVGVVFDTERQREGLGASISLATGQLWAMTKATVEVPKMLFTPERKELGSIVGAYETTRQATKSSLAEGVLIAGIISLGLAIINLFPILPLDGGHFMASVWYMIRRKRLSLTVQERWSVLGLVFVLILFAVGLSNDIGRIADGTLGQFR
jgi:regulator of sigma E protease